MTEPVRTIPVLLSDGQLIRVQVSPGPREEDVAFRPAALQGLANVVQGIASEFVAGFKHIRPDKATVEFGVEVALESGELTAIVLKGSGKANFKISLEWRGNSAENQEEDDESL